MSQTRLTRRGLLAVTAAAVTTSAQAQDLVAAATKEGSAVFHTSIDLPVAQKMVSDFQTLYPGIRIQLERTGAERVLQRIEQEYASGIHAADVVESSDVTMFLGWKKKNWLARYIPAEVAKFWSADEKDPDGLFASVRAQLSVIAYNTKQVKPEDAPKSFKDLLNERWKNRMVKAHPGYSGTIVTSTYATEKALGWEYFDTLAKQRIMQVQSASDPPKKVAQGERSIMVDGSEYVVFYLRESGNPIQEVYATEGSPLISGQVAVMQQAAHPAAARLFAEYLFTARCQQLMADAGGTRSFHPEVKLQPGRKPLSEIKVLRSVPTELEAAVQEVKQKYTEYFGV